MTDTGAGLIGRTIAGRYRVDRRLGQGGMGAIYLATQQPLGRPVVLKVLLDAFQHDQVAVTRFEKEALSISRLVHPHIVTLFDFGHTETGALFIAMEYLSGRSLREVIHFEGRLAWPRALHVVIGIAQGLAEAHRHGIIHRDLKPENVMMVRSGDDDDFPKILDFGLARSLDAGAEEGGNRVTQQNMIPGTPAYIAPERVNGLDDDTRSDLYSLGALWFELVTGQVPFDAPTPIKVIVKHLQEPPRRPSLVARDNAMPRELEDHLLRLLQKRPEERPQDARQLLKLIQPFATQEAWAAASSQEISDPKRRSAEAEALRAWAEQAGEIPDLDFGNALGLVEAPAVEEEPVLLLTQKKRSSPIDLVMRKDIVGADVVGAVPEQLDPLKTPSREDEPVDSAAANPFDPSASPVTSPPLLDTQEVPRTLVQSSLLDERTETGDLSSVAVAAARMSACRTPTDLGRIIVRYLRWRFDRALVLDLRPVPFRVLAAEGCLPLDEPMRVFEPARGFWELVRRREPYYGPSPDNNDWKLFHSGIGGRRPGAILVATLRRAGFPALTVYAEHDQAELFPDLSDTAVLLKEAAAAMSVIGDG